jgi:type II secretory pathway component PulM
MALSERARDFWDRISPRERKLVVFLGFGIPLALAIWLGLSIRDGLTTMEARNEQTREALETVARLKAAGGPVAEDSSVKIPDSPMALATYVDKALTKNGLKNKGSIDERKATKNGVVTTTVSCSVDDISTDQLKSFLTDVESDKIVAVTHLDVKRDRRDTKKLDATFEISTYSNAEKAKTDDAKDDKTDDKKEGG